jgi:hypothetical protein
MQKAQRRCLSFLGPAQALRHGGRGDAPAVGAAALADALHGLDLAVFLVDADACIVHAKRQWSVCWTARPFCAAPTESWSRTKPQTDAAPCGVFGLGELMAVVNIGGMATGQQQTSGAVLPTLERGRGWTKLRTSRVDTQVSARSFDLAIRSRPS